MCVHESILRGAARLPLAAVTGLLSCFFTPPPIAHTCRRASTNARDIINVSALDPSHFAFTQSIDRAFLAQTDLFRFTSALSHGRVTESVRVH